MNFKIFCLIMQPGGHGPVDSHGVDLQATLQNVSEVTGPAYGISD